MSSTASILDSRIIDLENCLQQRAKCSNYKQHSEECLSDNVRKQLGIEACPNCKTLIEKDGGCELMVTF
jgi:hypothetical protein